MRITEQPDRDNATAITNLNLEYGDGSGTAYVRLLTFAPDRKEVGVTVRGTVLDPEAAAWLPPEAAAEVADVLAMVAHWPADAIAALAAALRRSAAAAEGVRS